MARTRYHLFLARAPMALPLVAVVGVLLGAWWWVLSAAALASALLLRAWRVALWTLLTLLFSALHLSLLQERAELLRNAGGAVEYTGIVTRCTDHSLVLDAGFLQPAVLVCGAWAAEPGDKLRVLALPREKEPEAALTPGLFDRGRWLRSEGIAAELELIRAQPLGHPWSWAALRAEGLRWREWQVRRLMPQGTEGEEWRRLLCALLLGDRDSAGEDTLNLFRRGGCMHVFAVSGLHVGIIAFFLFWIFRFLRVRPALSRLLILLLLGLYVMLTGCAVPAIRAYLMLAVVLVGLIARLRVTAPNTWCAAALLTLLVAPEELYSTGFLLSYGVYAAIGFGAGLCQRLDAPWFGPDAYLPFRVLTPWELRVKNAESWLRMSVVVSLSAWLMAFPIMWACFHVVNPYAVLCNIALAVPLTLCMGAGLFYLLLGSIPWVGAVVQWIAKQTATLLLGLVAWFGELPCAYLAATPPAARDAVLSLPERYGSGCCVLGNPGLLIGSGSEATVRYELLPELFHRGYCPAALLSLPVTPSQCSGEPQVLHQYPQLRRVDSAVARSIRTAAGQYFIFPPPDDLPTSPAANRLPLVLWVQPSGYRILYVGDASALSLRTVPPEERHVDEIIIGRHPTAPLTEQDAEDWGATKVRRCPRAER